MGRFDSCGRSLRLQQPLRGHFPIEVLEGGQNNEDGLLWFSVNPSAEDGSEDEPHDTTSEHQPARVDLGPEEQGERR